MKTVFPMSPVLVVVEALKKRDAEWRAALCPISPEHFGPKDPNEARVYREGADRVDKEWRRWMADERDRLTKELEAAERKISSLKAKLKKARR